MVINFIGTSLRRIVPIFCVMLSASDAALAHDPGLSAAEIRIGKAQADLAEIDLGLSAVRLVDEEDAALGPNLGRRCGLDPALIRTSASSGA